MLVKPFLTGQRNRPKKPVELLLVPMIDIFTVLVTFLLMTAVFSRITIIQLDLPSSAAASPTEPEFRLEVIVRKEGFELTNGSDLIAALPTVNGPERSVSRESVAAAKRKATAHASKTRCWRQVSRA